VATPRLQLIPGGAEAAGPLDLSQLYRSYAGPVHGRCLYLLRSHAEAQDATQEVFMRAMAHLTTFRGDASPLTWLLTIATRHCLNLIRAKGALWQQKVARSEGLRVVDGSSAPDAQAQLRDLLKAHDEETQTAAVLYHVDEMTMEEVAAALGRSVPTVRKRLQAFAEAARAQLEREGGLP
jgi:RNA polymerase sigma-70 factor (ECF subfamily)